MKRLQFILLLLFTMAGTPFAQPFTVTFNTFDGTTYDPLVIMQDTTPVRMNNLIQLIKVGPNGVPDPAHPITGAVAGDDSLVCSSYMGDGTLMDGAFSFSVTAFNPPFPRPFVYIRVWCGFGNTIVSSIPVPPRSYYSQTTTYQLPTTSVDIFDVQVLPNSSAPTWTCVNALPQPEFSIGIENGSTINFGRVFIRNLSTFRCRVTNLGTANLTISPPVVTGPFTALITRDTLAPQDTANLEVTYHPTIIGVDTGSVQFTHNAFGSPFRLMPFGEGVTRATADLSLFVAEPGDRCVSIRWRTDSEYNSDHFTLLRCLGDTGVFTQIANIPATVVSTLARDYLFIDTTVINDSTYRYQLAVTDRQGSEHLLSPIVSVTPTSTGIVNHAPLIITKYALSSHPNPFNPTTHITFDLKEAGNVSLVVYDVTGKRVATLASGRFNAGRFTTEFNAENLPAGIYFARLSVNKYSEIRKLVLVK